MDRDTDLFPSSPTNSSTSSSDLDTMSTGSFFHDRSTTLGTLMGLTSPGIQPTPIRAASGRRATAAAAAVLRGDGSGRKTKARRAGCWRLCGGDVGPTSLEEFLRAERRLGENFMCGDVVVAEGGGRLFMDGRVLPPPAASSVGRRRREGEASGSIGRLPVMIAGICNGGEW
ncbi:uncharacterized protein At3g17950 [Phalaenopsis equestris]|uniref:uncharacterized protein At3g17950 n=1 Tax=Phalaenopsis equestris TaxID=78828 RepID=UPI0009E63B89|nr:uncharacterized protein At3g17950 [Phalaenopsis equestris]